MRDRQALGQIELNNFRYTQQQQHQALLAATMGHGHAYGAQGSYGGGGGGGFGGAGPYETHGLSQLHAVDFGDGHRAAAAAGHGSGGPPSLGLSQAHAAHGHTVHQRARSASGLGLGGGYGFSGGSTPSFSALFNSGLGGASAGGAAAAANYYLNFSAGSGAGSGAMGTPFNSSIFAGEGHLPPAGPGPYGGSGSGHGTGAAAALQNFRRSADAFAEAQYALSGGVMGHPMPALDQYSLEASLAAMSLARQSGPPGPFGLPRANSFGFEFGHAEENPFCGGHVGSSANQLQGMNRRPSPGAPHGHGHAPGGGPHDLSPLSTMQSAFESDFFASSNASLGGLGLLNGHGHGDGHLAAPSSSSHPHGQPQQQMTGPGTGNGGNQGPAGGARERSGGQGQGQGPGGLPPRVPQRGRSSAAFDRDAQLQAQGGAIVQGFDPHVSDPGAGAGAGLRSGLAIGEGLGGVPGVPGALHGQGPPSGNRPPSTSETEVAALLYHGAGLFDKLGNLFESPTGAPGRRPTPLDEAQAAAYAGLSGSGGAGGGSSATSGSVARPRSVSASFF